MFYITHTQNYLEACLVHINQKNFPVFDLVVAASWHLRSVGMMHDDPWGIASNVTLDIRSHEHIFIQQAGQRHAAFTVSSHKDASHGFSTIIVGACQANFG